MAYYNHSTSHPGMQQFYPDPRAQNPTHGFGQPQQNQQPYSGHPPDGMSMPPPSMSSMNNPTAVQQGITQRQQQYPQYRNNQQMSAASSAYLQSQAAFNSPPATQSFYSQTAPPIPSPTCNQPPPNSGPPSQPPMASAMAQPTPSSQVGQPPAQHLQKPQATPTQKPILQRPLSPDSAKLETQRVTILLQINSALLQEIVHLQTKGRAGQSAAQLPGPSRLPQEKSASTEGDGDSKTENGDSKDNSKSTKEEEGEKPRAASNHEYIQCMRRLQCNLAYLASIADRLHKPLNAIPSSPAIMEALPTLAGNVISEQGMQDLRDMYAALRELYPELAKKNEVTGQTLNQGNGNTPQTTPHSMPGDSGKAVSAVA